MNLTKTMFIVSSKIHSSFHETKLIVHPHIDYRMDSFGHPYTYITYMYNYYKYSVNLCIIMNITYSEYSAETNELSVKLNILK